MTVAAFILSCISLPLAITGTVLGVLTYRRGGARLEVSMSVMNTFGTGGMAGYRGRVYEITVRNTGLAAVQISNPHWRPKGQQPLLPVDTASPVTLEGLSPHSWHYDVSKYENQLLRGSANEIVVRPGVFTAAGKGVYGKPFKIVRSPQR